jgi:hypothetical protein
MRESGSNAALERLVIRGGVVALAGTGVLAVADQASAQVTVYTLPTPVTSFENPATGFPAGAIWFSPSSGDVTLAPENATLSFNAEYDMGHRVSPDGCDTTQADGVGVEYDPSSSAECTAASDLSSGDIVGPSASFTGNTWLYVTDGSTYDWAAGDTGYLGLQMPDGGGQDHYGWADITLGAPGPNGAPDITLYSMAYDATPNEDVTIGAPPEFSEAATILPPIAAPEPSSLALLAVGASGIGVLRQRRLRL